MSPLVIWTVVLGSICASSCALVGCYLVLRRMSLLGDAISHAVLPGIALAILWEGRIAFLPIFLGALAFGILTAVLTQGLAFTARVSEDASMGVVFTSLFAVGVLIAKLAEQSNIDFDPGCVLYGQIELKALDTVPYAWLGGAEIPESLPRLVIIMLVVIGCIIVLWKEFRLVAFDPMLATAMGVNAVVIHYVLMALVATVTVASFEAVGSILVIAMLIVPPAAAHLLSDRLGGMMIWSVIIAIASSVLGFWGAWTWNTSTAGMMAVVSGVLFALAVAFAPRHGLLSKAWHSLAMSYRIHAEDYLATLFRREELPAVATERIRTRGLGHAILTRGLRWQGLIIPLSPLSSPRPVPDPFCLTETGRTRARDLVRTHRLWEVFLETNFQLPRDHLHAPAERMEHFIGPNLQRELADSLARPTHDPHGRAIPEPAAADASASPQARSASE